MNEKDTKIANLKSKLDLINLDLQHKESRNAELSSANLNLMKKIDNLHADLDNSDAQV